MQEGGYGQIHILTRADMGYVTYITSCAANVNVNVQTIVPFVYFFKCFNLLLSSLISLF